ncbi:MAG: indole-3-glycerol phosphate synthase TrpC [Lachnospiraceae bacterium]|nr:indole-3-glycerol phosphate synthase TrpC [Lachnospiraceae bacterium]
MLNILQEIAERTVQRVAEAKKEITPAEMKKRAENCGGNADFPFATALKKKGLSFICEVKKASPSKGIIAEDFPYVQIAETYERAGADALSVLTEPYYFKGSNDYLREIREHSGLPILRKDFTVDEYMIYEAKVLGADAVLLICAILTDAQLAAYVQLAKSLGMSALVEAHDGMEVERALACKASIIGVNNRNLKDFSVDIENSVRLRKMVPEDIIFVSESGIKTPQDVQVLMENGTDAVLIGETLMRSGNVQETLAQMRKGKDNAG